MDRRQMLHTGLAAFAGAVTMSDTIGTAEAASEQSKPGSQGRPLGAFPLGAAFGDGWQGSMTEVTYPPGAESASHQHPGPTFGYVVRGRIKWAINGEPAKILGPGESFFEPMGSVHSTAANASDTEPAVLVAIILGKSGEPLSKPATVPRPRD